MASPKKRMILTVVLLSVIIIAAVISCFFAVGDPARRSRDGDGKIPAPVGPVTARAVSRSEMEPNGDKRRVVGRGATLERSESGVGQNIGPGGADDRTRGFAAGETEA